MRNPVPAGPCQGCGHDLVEIDLIYGEGAREQNLGRGLIHVGFDPRDYEGGIECCIAQKETK